MVSVILLYTISLPSSGIYIMTFVLRGTCYMTTLRRSGQSIERQHKRRIGVNRRQAHASVVRFRSWRECVGRRKRRKRRSSRRNRRSRRRERRRVGRKGLPVQGEGREEGERRRGGGGGREGG